MFSVIYTLIRNKENTAFLDLVTWPRESAPKFTVAGSRFLFFFFSFFSFLFLFQSGNEQAGEKAPPGVSTKYGEK